MTPPKLVRHRYMLDSAKLHTGKVNKKATKEGLNQFPWNLVRRTARSINYVNDFLDKLS